MELRQLRYVIAVADHRHFTRAAASVPVAQPALSHQVRLLEQELGIELFERSRSGVRPTEAGEIFLLRARRALAEMDAAREEIAAFKGLTSGRLVLGAMQALAGLDLPRLLAAFHAAHPGIDVSLREDSTRDMFTLAARGEIDLAIAALDVERPPGLDAVPLVREPVLMALPAAHSLASHEAVPLRLLRHDTFILFKEGTGLRAVSDRAAKRAGFVPRVGFQTSSHDRLLALVSEGLGVAFVPASAVSDPPPPGLVVLPVSPGVERTVGAVWRADHRHTPAASAFLALLRERARPAAAGSLVRRRLRTGRGAQAVECGLEYRFQVTSVATERGNGDDHVQSLLERQVVTDLAGLLGGGEERPCRGEYPLAVVAEYGVAAVRVLKQLRSDGALAGDKAEEPAQPYREGRAWRFAAGGLGGRADGVDLVDEEGLEELTPAGEVAVERRHAHAGAARDLGHRHLRLRVGERGAGDGEDLVAVALGVGSSRR
jgi:LysR family transcriptional activator of glutamate synthase operon